MSDELPGEDEDQAVSLETLLARRPSPRRRALRAAVLAAAVAVVGALLVREYRAAAPAASSQPTPSGPGVVTVIESNTTWGTLTVNGRRLPGPPPQAVRLYAGLDYVITLEAAPFAPVTCHAVVVPYTLSGTPAVLPGSRACGYGRLDASFGRLSGASVISFDLEGSALPADQRVAALRAVAAALVAQEVRATVPTGEYYATGFAPDGEPLSARAAAPLVAAEGLVPAPPFAGTQWTTGAVWRARLRRLVRPG